MTETTTKNRPSHILYMQEGEGENSIKTELGALWKHSKGDGFNLSLKVLPNVPGARLVIFPRREPKQEAGQ